ncbi:MAG: formyltetrahydrofolate deformylase [Sphingomonadaceae bacterium]
MTNAHILTLSCKDQKGLVAAVAGFLFRQDANILEAQQFDDTETGKFFMRVVFDWPVEKSIIQLRADFTASVADPLGMSWRINPRGHRSRVLLLVSKFDHCLADLLYRQRIGELPMDISGIICNHPKEALNVPMMRDIPFHYLPVTRETKAEQEARVREIIEETGTELVVLARYMQILSAEMAAFLTGRCINIHHSFLPGFKGARPYHQAHARGVKMIGASAHYVTGDLDEGPIIVQDVEPITHADTPEMLVQKGRDIERRVLARAVHYHLDDRVLINGAKTVVFTT